MTTTVLTDDVTEAVQNKPGECLAVIREQKGYSSEYVASKLHLRVRLIELLEADDYQSMPEPVFIKGYIRAYAKLLDVHPEPLLEMFHRLYKSERKSEKTLWQSRRETNKAEHAIRWLTGFFAVIVLSAVAMWWYSNKDNEALFPSAASRVDVSSNKSESDIRLTDLSKMRSLLSSRTEEDVIQKPAVTDTATATATATASNESLLKTPVAEISRTEIMPSIEKQETTTEKVGG